MKFYYGKAGGLLPEKNEHFLTIREAARLGKQEELLLDLLMQKGGLLVYFDPEAWEGADQTYFEVRGRLTQEITEHGEGAFFNIRDFFHVRQTHCYFNWTQCWRAQRADSDFTATIYGSSLHHRKTTRKERIELYMNVLEAEAKHYGLGLSKSFVKKMERLGSSKLASERAIIVSHIRYHLLYEYQKEGVIFVKAGGKANKELFSENSHYKYFTKQLFIKHSDRKPMDGFDVVNLGERKLLRPS